jgi:F-type H+-transporting ATPase subunit gamma
MASIKDLKKRIASVKNTQQTTKAMKMVSAAKLRRAQEAIASQRPYAQRVAGMLKKVGRVADLKNPLLAQSGTSSEDEAKSQDRRCALLVVVTSDRGLCGGFNGNVVKAAQRWIEANRASYGKLELAFLGRKGFESMRGKDLAVWKNFSELSGKVSFSKAKVLSSELISKYTEEGNLDVFFIYNEFKNAVTQRVVTERFLPFDLHDDAAAQEGSIAGSADGFGLLLVKPSVGEFGAAVLDKHFNAQTFRIMLESQAGEHGARMAAMESATKNAGEMIKKLTLQFNKQRQANITKELLEIISGSEAQKN